MDATDFRFSITADKYLEKHNVLVYIEDAIIQLLDHKDENLKVNSTKFLSEYFVSVREGNHTLFREYAFTRATPHNRACFVKTFWKCYRNIGRKGDLLSVKEYHSLLCLLCSDFPFTPVQKTAKIILMDDSVESLMSFSDFLFAFQVQFCFDEFLTRCAEVYKDLLKTKQNSHDPVVVPTSEEATPRIHEDENSAKPEGVDAMTFLRSLIPLCEHYGQLAPSLPVLRDILSSAERVTFYGFLLALAKNERLNTAIGKLPNRGELLDSTEKDLTSMDLLLRRSTYRQSVADQLKKTKRRLAQDDSGIGRQATRTGGSLPALRPGSAKPRPGSASSAHSSANQINAGTTSSAPNSADSASHQSKAPPTNVGSATSALKPVNHVKPARLQKKLLRKQTSSDSDDDDDDTDDSTDTN